YGHVQHMRGTLTGLTGYRQVGHALLETLGEPVAETAQTVGLGLLPGSGELGRTPECDRSSDGFGSGPDAVLLAATVNDCLDRLAVAHDERTDTLGRPDLVSGERQHGARHPAERDRNLAECLHGVGMECDPCGAAARRNLCHWLDDADLVVDPHDGD